MVDTDLASVWAGAGHKEIEEKSGEFPRLVDLTKLEIAITTM